MNVASQARFAPPEANIPGEGLRSARRIQPIKWAKSFSSSNVRCSIMPHRTFKHFMCRRSTKNDLNDHLLLIDFATKTHIHTYSYMDLHYMQLLPPSTWGSVQKTKPLRLRCSKPSFNTTAEPRWGRSPPPAVPGAEGISRSTAEQCERTNSTRRYLTFTRRDASRFWRSSSRPFP